MSFNVDTIDLSMADPSTGEFLTANIYYVANVTDASGAPRPLSIGQLVMAICLQRAAELETDIIKMMDEMNEISQRLADMTSIEQTVVDYFKDNPSEVYYSLENISGAVDLLREEGILDSSQHVVRTDAIRSAADIMYDDFISKLESKMDEKNSFSQQKMIELQSLTNKRDQSYDMISNILKSLNTVLTGIVNNT